MQLYVRDLVGDVTTPVKELKGFQESHDKERGNIDSGFYNFSCRALHITIRT